MVSSTEASLGPRAGLRWARLVPGVLAGLLVVQALCAASANSVTFDETYYLGAGLQAWRAGDFSGFAAEHVAPLPILIAFAPAAFDPRARERLETMPRPAQAADLWTGRPGDPPLVGRARIANAVLMAVPLVLLLHRELAGLGGQGVAGVAAALLALSPTLVASAALATTDVGAALAVLMLLVAVDFHRRRGSGVSSLLVGLVFGVALAAKLTALALTPIVLWSLWRHGRPRPALGGARVASGLLLAFLVTWALHDFTYAQAGGRLVPAPLAGLFVLRQEAGQPDQFLLGRRSQTGWPHYFLVTFLWKSTPAELVVAGLVVARLALALTRRVQLGEDEKSWLAAVALLAGATTLAPFDIGHRHILPLYPLLLMVGVGGWAHRFRSPAGAALALVLVASQAGEASAAAPRPLTYFNGFAGGRARAHQALVDSNLDWGQDLHRVGPAALAAGCRAVALFYFGTAAPEAYGLDRDEGAEPECVAVSVTLLQGVYVPDDRFASFRPLPETSRAGESIFLYRVGDPGVGAALQVALGARGRYSVETASGVFTPPPGGRAPREAW